MTQHISLHGTEFDLIPHPSWPAEGQHEYEPEVSAAMARLVKPGDCVVDVGANLGWFSCFLSRLVGEEGLVMAFEPDPANFVMLEQNVAVNRLGNVYCGPTMLWSHDTSMDFFAVGHGGYSSYINFVNVPSTKHRVVARSLDSLMATTDEVPSLIKVDCEGAELKVLYGCEQVLRRGVESVIAEFNFDLIKQIGPYDRELRDYMSYLGFGCFLLIDTEDPVFLPPSSGLRADPGVVNLNVLFKRL